MNRWLVSTLSALNLLVAVLITVAGGAIGMAALRGNGFGLILGLGVGFLVSAIVCGVLAALCLIEKHLRVLADDALARRKLAERPSAGPALPSGAR